MTYPTKSISSVLLSDSCKIMEQKILQKTNSGINPHPNDHSGASEYGFFTISDVWSCMEKVKAIQLHQTVVISGIKITPYYAGHVLGAAMFHIQVNDETIVYTGDFNMVRDRHLGPALIPKLFPSLLLSESTYATYVRPSRRSTERAFCEMVLSCLKRGGKVLIPVFAIGRAQELCILLEIFWRRMQLRYPIFFGGSMTEKANSYYQLFTNWTNTPLSDNIFTFPHVLPYDKSILTLSGPAVLFATPGMLHTGLSLQAFKVWAPDPNNLTIIPGFCVSGTIGSKIINGAKRVFVDQKDPSTCIEVRCDVKYLSFSSHADSIGIQSLISHSEPQSIAFVHGEKQGMLNLASFVNTELKVPSFCPHNGSITILSTNPKNNYSSYLSTGNLSIRLFKTLGKFNIPNIIKTTSESITKQRYEHFISSKRILEMDSMIETNFLKALPTYLFSSKYKNQFHSYVVAEHELFYLSRVKSIYTFLQVFNKNPRIYDENEKFLINQPHYSYIFNLSFYSEVYLIKLSTLLNAIRDLQGMIYRSLRDQENTSIPMLNGYINQMNSTENRINATNTGDTVILTYRSLIACFYLGNIEQEIISSFLSSINNSDYNTCDYEAIIIDEVAISWSYIDNKNVEIMGFLKYLELNASSDKSLNQIYPS
ncbi:Integrator complex subunit 11 [Cryptosporidium felis]|nr:Integrator complex subunit 11 [Cryptosporidium felis]